MAEITSIDEYRRRRGRPVRKPGGPPETPRARAAGEPIFDVEEVLRHLQAIHVETAHRLLDSLEEALIDRLDQIRRFGLGLSRRISVAVARRVNHQLLRDQIRSDTKSPNLQLRRGLYVRMLEVPLTLAGYHEPVASAYLVLHRAEGMLTLAVAAVKRNGTLAETRFALRRPCAAAYWSRDVVDQLLRRYLRRLFEELETGGKVRRANGSRVKKSGRHSENHEPVEGG